MFMIFVFINLSTICGTLAITKLINGALTQYIHGATLTQQLNAQTCIIS